MATLKTPAPAGKKGQPKRQPMWIERLLRSRYFLIAFLVHIVIFLMISTVVVFKAFVQTGEFDEGSYVAGDDGGPPPPPAAPPTESNPQEQTVPVPATAATMPTDLLAVDSTSAEAFTVPLPAVISPTPTLAKNSSPAPTVVPSTSSNFAARAEGIKNFTGAWGKGGKGVQGRGKTTVAEFFCYTAKYSNGDWDSGIEYNQKDGSILGGSVKNLTHYIEEHSNNRIKASLIPRPLDLSSPEIFEKKPPFIFFSGHKDFVLTQKEVENLQKYLTLGGAIWGDNMLAGYGSRFDVAFRREMKRVIPDDDKPFEVVPDNHPLYTDSFYPLKGVPPGMNYYQEPMETIKIDGEIAVLYTLNNYTDMLRMAFKPNSTDMLLILYPKDRAKEWYNTWRPFRDRSDSFFRGFEPESCDKANQLSVNIIVHLLTRFEDKLMR